MTYQRHWKLQQYLVIVHSFSQLRLDRLHNVGQQILFHFASVIVGQVADVDAVSYV